MNSPEQQRRDRDWSILANQVVGGESSLEDRDIVVSSRANYEKVMDENEALKRTLNEWPRHDSPAAIKEACGLKDENMNLPPKCPECGRQCVWVWGIENSTMVCPRCRLLECRELRKKVKNYE